MALAATLLPRQFLATNLRPIQAYTSHPDHSCRPTSSTIATHHAARPSPVEPPRSNPHSALAAGPHRPIAVSSLGGFRTPALRVRGPVRDGPASENLHRNGHSRLCSPQVDNHLNLGGLLHRQIAARHQRASAKALVVRLYLRVSASHLIKINASGRQHYRIERAELIEGWRP
jgi:hypothetical protein